MVTVAAWLVAAVCALVLLPYAIDLILRFAIAILWVFSVVGKPLYSLERWLVANKNRRII